MGFKTTLIADSQTKEINKALLDSFKVLYDNGFPDDDEREDFEEILTRLCNESEIPRSVILLCHDSDTDKVLGGFVADWYRSIGTLHSTYVIVDPQARRKGIAKKMISDGIPKITHYLKEKENVNITSNFFESNNPYETTTDNFDPKTRLEIFSTLGAKLIPIDYVQPSLGEGKGKVRNLLLLTFSQFNKDEMDRTDTMKMAASDVIGFLWEFYQTTNNKDDDKDLLEMIKQINCLGKNNENASGQMCLYPETIRMEELADRIDKPAYHFETCSVTNHFFVANKKCIPNKKCRQFHSFETDLFNYENQGNPSFSTSFEEYIDNVQIIIPKWYYYFSEGRTYFRHSQKQSLDASLSINQTIFKNGDSIVHFTVEPKEGTAFSELDIIKLSLLFGSKQEQVSYSEEGILIKDPTVKSGKPISIQAILAHYMKDSESDYEPLRTGIIQLIPAKTAESKSDLFFKSMYEDDKASAYQSSEDFANMLCGIALGIFDFRRMELGEFEDTIFPFCKTAESFYVLNRGVLLSITSDKKLITRTPEIIVSPYLLIPNTVLAHNRYILDDAEKQLNDIMQSKENIEAFQKCTTEIGNILNESYINDVFHYPRERKILDCGDQQRGIKISLSNIKRKKAVLLERIDRMNKKSSSRSANIMNTLLGVVAFMQMSQILDLDRRIPFLGYVVVLSLSFITICFVYWINRNRDH